MKYRILLALLLIVVAIVSFQFYPYLFARTVEGEVMGIERVIQPTAIIGNNIPNNQIYSFAVAIRDERKSEIVTASSEDRQWAVVQKGQCARAKFFPYPPWNLDKANTYYNARLEKLFDCPKEMKSEPPVTAKPTAPAPPPAPSP